MTENLPQSKIQASDGKKDDYFGESVSLSGNVALVGARYEDTGGRNAGAAYLFERLRDGTWKEVQKLQASDCRANTDFGTSVSLDGNLAIVGAPYEDTGGSNTGAAYLFERLRDGTWKEVQKLRASDHQSDDHFGWSVSLDGNLAIVGAPYEDTGGTNTGAVYLFERLRDGTWKEVQKVEASNHQANDQFGWSVSLDGNVAIVGAYGENRGGGNVGAAYLFERLRDGTWKEVQKLKASDPQTDDRFGWSVSLSGNGAIVGAYGEDSGGPDAGAAYLFERLRDGTWKEVQKVQASDAQAKDHFGHSVSISENFAIVGARDSGGDNIGAAYLFERQAQGNWIEVEKLQAAEAGLSPLLFHDDFSQYAQGTVVSNGDTLDASQVVDEEDRQASLRWEVIDEVQGPSRWEVGESGSPATPHIVQTSNIYGDSDNRSELRKRGTLLVRGDNAWTDYRITLFVRSADNDAFGVVFRYRDANTFYRFSMDNQRTYRRLVRVDGGNSSLLIEDSFAYEPNRDYRLAIEAIGHDLRVYQDGVLVFAVTDDSIASGRLGLYCWANEGTQFKDVRVHKLQAKDGKVGDQFGASVALDAGLAIVGAQLGDGKVVNSGTAYLFELSLARESNIGQALTHNVVANDAQAGDDLARSVSLSGSLAGVGAPGEGNKAGAAYLFERSHYDFWEQMQKVVAYDREPNDDFGRSISLDGTLVAVGAPNKGDKAGAVYLFSQQSDEAWQLVQKLVPQDHEPKHYFGHSVWLDGSIVMVGAYGEGEMAGAVYVFEQQEDGRWEETKKLTAEDRGENNGFGKSVSLDGNLAIVGADVDNNEKPGAAYFFKREEDGSWTAGPKVQASDNETNDHFAHSVYLNGELAIVGAYGKDSAGPDSGAAYIFKYSDGSWRQSQKIMACDRRSGEQFGYSVSLNGSVAAVSSFDGQGYGSNGAVYLFQQLSNGLWVEVKKLVDRDLDLQNHFGSALSQDGNLVMIGAAMQDAGPENAGAAYITPYEQEDVASGGPTKMASGSTEAGNTHWQVNAKSLFVEIDTSAAAFSDTPKYFTTLGGVTNHWDVKGVTSIENANKDGFRLTLQGPETMTPELANERKWHINWFAVGPDGVLPC